MPDDTSAQSSRARLVCREAVKPHSLPPSPVPGAAEQRLCGPPRALAPSELAGSWGEGDSMKGEVGEQKKEHQRMAEKGRKTL